MKTFKRILKILGYSAGGLLILLILFVLFTQTQFFKDRLRVILASSISTNINGTLHLGTIEGNFLTGFSIDSLAIYDDEGIFLTTGKITCRYDLIPVLEKRVRVKFLIIEQPSVKFIRSNRGSWNLDRLIKSDTVTTTSTFDWTLQFVDIELKNATVRLIDSTSLLAPDHWNMPSSYFEYHNFSINDLNIKLSSLIKENEITTKIEHLSCYSPQSEFELTHFRGNFSITKKGVFASNTIIQTGKSYLELDASMRGINIFEGIQLHDLEHDSTRLQLKAKNIDLKELRSFIPQIHFLDGSALIDLNANGEFGNLAINNLNLKTFGSTLNLSGSIRNLHNPGELFLNVHTDKSGIAASDIPKLLPGLPIPAFRDDELLNFTTEFIGKPIDFKTQTSLNGINSSVNIIGGMNLEQKPPSYNFSFATKNVDLVKYLNLENLTTSISSYGTVAGEGFSIDDIKSSLEVTIDSSSIRNIPITHSTLSINGQPNRLEGTLHLTSHGMKAHIQTSIDFSQAPLPQFDGSMELTSFNLAKITKNEKYSSDINLQGKFTGSGSKLENLNTEINFSLLPSKFQDHELVPDKVLFAIDQTDPKQKRLTIQSQIIDGEISGSFDVVHSSRTIADYTAALIETIEEHATPDSDTSSNIRKGVSISSRFDNRTIMDFQYEVSLKNLDPVSSLLSEIPFNAQAHLKGTIENRDRNLSFTCDGVIDEFYVGTTKGGVLLNKARLICRADSLNMFKPLERLSMTMDLTVDSGLINTQNLDDINLSFGFDHHKGKLSGYGTFDSIYSLNINGEISVQPNTYVLDLDSLVFSANNSIWKNDQDVQLRLNYDGLRIMHAAFKRNHETISISGALLRSGDLSLSAIARRLSLSGLSDIFQGRTLSSQGEGFSGSANIDMHLTGSTASPIIKLNAVGENVYFRKTKIGQLTADFDYTDQIVSINADVKESTTDTKPILTIDGTIPINLALTKVDRLFPEKHQSLELKSDGFNVGILDPLLKDFDNLNGVLRCNIKLTGTPEYPQYEGTISLSNTKFLFIPSNVNYVLNSDLEASGDKIKLKSLSIKNQQEKGLSGETNVSGFFTIKNFNIDSFDLNANGQFLLMTEATRKTSPSVYGTLFTETDPAGVSLKGTLNRPYLTGKLFIREANLTFPPTKTTQLANSNLSLQYRVLDDTSKVITTDQKVSKYYVAAEESSDTTLDQPLESPIIDRLRYNVVVETRGPTTLTMIFTPTTGEELYAELDGKVSVINEQGVAAIYGEIEVSPRSYYNFFKRFDASGKLKFVGQWNNPELDIQANYEGYKQETSQQISEQQSGKQDVPDGSQLKEQKVIVELKITGTRYEPKLSMGMKVQEKTGEEPVDYSTLAKGGDVQSDAISFIITGKFRDELTSREQQEFTDLGAATGTSVASSLLSSIFSDVLKREFPFIRRADVTYRGGSVQEGTSVNVTATAFKGYLRVGGKIFQDIGNANVSYQLSLGDFFNATSIRNLYFEIQRKVEGDNPEDKKLTNEARFFYRFSF